MPANKRKRDRRDWESASSASAAPPLCSSDDEGEESAQESSDALFRDSTADASSGFDSDSGISSDGDVSIDGFGNGAYESSDDDVEEDPAGDFINFCKSLLLLRVLNSRQFCILLYYAGLAGIREATKYGLRPAAKSGHFQRKVKSSCGFYNKTGTYEAKVPGKQRHVAGRSKVDVSFYPAHELIQGELEDNTVQ